MINARKDLSEKSVLIKDAVEKRLTLYISCYIMLVYLLKHVISVDLLR